MTDESPPTDPALGSREAIEACSAKILELQKKQKELATKPGLELGLGVVPVDVFNAIVFLLQERIDLGVHTSVALRARLEKAIKHIERLEADVQRMTIAPEDPA